MVSGPDPVESLVHAVRGALSPIEAGFSRAARDLESHLRSSRGEAGRAELLEKPGGLATKNRTDDAVFRVSAAAEETKKGFSAMKMPMKSLLGALFPNSSNGNGGGGAKADSVRKQGKEEARDGSCTNCLQFVADWSILLNNLAQAVPSPFKSVKKCFGTQREQEDESLFVPLQKAQSGEFHRAIIWEKHRDSNSIGDSLSLELLLCLAIDSLVHNFQMLELICKVSKPSLLPQFDHLKIIKGLISGKKADFDGFLSNMRFARVSGAPASLVGAASSSVSDENEARASSGGTEEPESSLPQKLASGLLNIPLSNVERLRSTLSTVSLTELIEFIPQLARSTTDHPDKKKLFSVQDFFRYTEAEGIPVIVELM